MSEEQTLTMDESQDTEVLSEEEQDSLKVGEAMEAEGDQLLAGKYKNAEELEKAHIELQKKLGEKSEPDSEKPKSKTEPEKEAPKDTEPNLLDQLWEEGTNNKLTKETFDKLSKMNPVDVAKLAMQQRSAAQNAPQNREFTDTDVQQIHGIVGGPEQYNHLMSWATQNVPEQEINMYDAVMELGNPLAAYFAVQSLALKYQDASGRDGRMVTGKAPKQTTDQFKSQAEMVKAMEDPRYNDDPAYREAILQKLERSNINF
tara:strand:+ start:100 stop:876 length:777 start_codon:yes stop_codon:yes gene_type:complete